MLCSASLAAILCLTSTGRAHFKAANAGVLMLYARARSSGCCDQLLGAMLASLPTPCQNLTFYTAEHYNMVTAATHSDIQNHKSGA